MAGVKFEQAMARLEAIVGELEKEISRSMNR